jgi:hypothetical protein
MLDVVQCVIRTEWDSAHIRIAGALISGQCWWQAEGLEREEAQAPLQRNEIRTAACTKRRYNNKTGGRDLYSRVPGVACSDPGELQSS